MRFLPGITLGDADDALAKAEMEWANVRGGSRTYFDTVAATYPQLRRIFVAPDLAGGIRSAAYWHLLELGDTRDKQMYTTDPDIAANWSNSLRALNDAFRQEVENQVAALAQARSELDALKVLASREGLPVIYDTNMLIAWQDPSQIDWQQTLRDQREQVTMARIIVPLRVIDELDRQKAGHGTLGKRADKAVRYLERTLTGYRPGESVQLRDGASLEIWTASDDRAGGADLAILNCAADVNALHPTTGVRVLTGDFGMQLRARQMALRTLALPDNRYRKPDPPAADL
jgi:hypothetical protein